MVSGLRNELIPYEMTKVQNTFITGGKHFKIKLQYNFHRTHFVNSWVTDNWFRNFGTITGRCVMT
jgi:hypothetical protein